TRSRSSSAPTTSTAVGSPTGTARDESPSVREAHVRTLPRDQAARYDHGHLLQPSSQAKAGVAGVGLHAIIGGARPAHTRRAAASSVAPGPTGPSAPCVLASLGVDDPG